MNPTIANGTKTWCPTCKKQTDCRVVSPLSRLKSTLIDGVYFLGHTRECNVCENRFDTRELDSETLDELIYDRIRLGNLKSYLRTLLSAKDKLTKLLAE